MGWVKFFKLHRMGGNSLQPPFGLISGPWALDDHWALGPLGTRSPWALGRWALGRQGTRSPKHSVAMALGRWALGRSIPHGTVLGPVLFLLHILDIAR